MKRPHSKNRKQQSHNRKNNHWLKLKAKAIQDEAFNSCGEDNHQTCVYTKIKSDTIAKRLERLFDYSSISDLEIYRDKDDNTFVFDFDFWGDAVGYVFEDDNEEDEPFDTTLVDGSDVKFTEVFIEFKGLVDSSKVDLGSVTLTNEGRQYQLDIIRSSWSWDTVGLNVPASRVKCEVRPDKEIFNNCNYQLQVGDLESVTLEATVYLGDNFDNKILLNYLTYSIDREEEIIQLKKEE